MLEFNVTGICLPEKHYMVNIQNKLLKIMEMAEDGRYFTINRARQFGKTTVLFSLEQLLNVGSHDCISLSFEGLDDMFKDEETFCKRFHGQVARVLKRKNPNLAPAWSSEAPTDFGMLADCIDTLCVGRQVFLIIDEVDAASNNKVFLNFLGMLRRLYLERDTGGQSTFHSVILAGVHDIKNIKLKMIKEGKIILNENERHFNSPWNIAADFEVDMAFDPQEISTMLVRYEEDHHTDMDIPVIADEIYRYTGGYPYLVSRVCMLIATKLDKNWTIPGVSDAVQMVSMEKNLLADDLAKHLESNQDIYDLLYDILMVGNNVAFSGMNPTIDRSLMYGYIMRKPMGFVGISNKIFEMILVEYFVSKDRKSMRVDSLACQSMYREIAAGGSFDMEQCLRKFAKHFRELFQPADTHFLEKHGRLVFLTFLRPLINGQGFFHIESQFTDLRRMDIIVDFAREQFVIELKLWRGEVARDRAYEQLADYLNTKSLDVGYLLTFDLRKSKPVEPTLEWVNVNGKQIFEVIV